MYPKLHAETDQSISSKEVDMWMNVTKVPQSQNKKLISCFNYNLPTLLLL